MDFARTSKTSERALAGALADIAHELSSPFEHEARIHSVLSVLCDIVPCGMAAVGVLFDGWNVFHYPESRNFAGVENFLLRQYVTLTGEKPDYDQSSGEIAVMWESDEGCSSFLSMPVIGSGQVLGVLHVRVDEPHVYSPENASVLSIVALQIGSFLKNEEARITEAKARGQIERLSSEAERRAAELESFISSMADGVIVFDSQGNVALINDAGRSILGLDADQPVEWWDYDRYTLDEEPVPIHQRASYRALQGETVKDYRYRIVLPSGKDVVLSVSSSPIRNRQGLIMGATVVFRDQRERVEIEKTKQALLEREHRIADMLQKALVPETTYILPGIEASARYVPSLKEAEVGGDFYDFFDLGHNKIGILIGDVAGKGLPAAIRVAAARHSIRSYAYLDPTPSRVLTLTNDALSKDIFEEGGMVTLFFAVVDIDSKTITYANGGHETPLVRNADGSINEMHIPGRVVGIQGGYQYPEGSRILQPGDTVILVTDGITEARENVRTLFGIEGVKTYLSHCSETAPDDIAAGLLDAAISFAGGMLNDDVAVVVFRLKDK